MVSPDRGEPPVDGQARCQFADRREIGAGRENRETDVTASGRSLPTSTIAPADAIELISTWTLPRAVS
jgi:hypothetical protein